MTTSATLDTVLYDPSAFWCDGTPDEKVMSFVQYRVRLYRRWKSMLPGDDRDEVKAVMDHLMMMSHEICETLAPGAGLYSEVEYFYQWFTADSKERRDFLIEQASKDRMALRLCRVS